MLQEVVHTADEAADAELVVDAIHQVVWLVRVLACDSEVNFLPLARHLYIESTVFPYGNQLGALERVFGPALDSPFHGRGKDCGQPFLVSIPV